jgi:hypothetical protein
VRSDAQEEGNFTTLRTSKLNYVPSEQQSPTFKCPDLRDAALQGVIMCPKFLRDMSTGDYLDAGAWERRLRIDML